MNDDEKKYVAQSCTFLPKYLICLLGKVFVHFHFNGYVDAEAQCP